MRIRSESTPSVTGTQTVVTWPYPQANIAGKTDVYNLDLGPSYKKTTKDVITPNFKILSASGGIANNPYESNALWQSIQGSYSTEQYRLETYDVKNQPVYGLAYSVSIDGPYLFAICKDIAKSVYPSLVSPWASLAASTGNQALSEVNPTKFNAGLFFLELGKTKALMTQLGPMLVEFFKTKHRYRSLGKSFSDESKLWANAYLSARFGILPLLYELQGACELLSKIRPPRETARAQAVSNLEASSTFILNDGASQHTIKIESTLESTSRSGILYALSDRTAAHVANLGLTRPASIAWELVPYSFVIDRFVDIGTWLDAIQPNGLAEYLAAWQGTRARRHDYWSWQSVHHGANYGKGQRNTYCSLNTSIITLEKARNPWVPTASIPPWRPKFSLTHLADYAAMIRQRIRLSR